MSDNSGDGAPGDSTYVLDAILERGDRDVAVGMIFDPGAVAIARDAGEGTTLSLRIGGKLEAASGQPLDVTAEVKAVRENCSQHLGSAREPMGTAVWLALPGRVDVVLNDVRVQVYHPEVFTQLGIDLRSKRLIAVKSLFHFYTAFAALASEIIFCATPGRLNCNFETLTYTRRSIPLWPFDADPWADA
ncbi:MAG: MlrC C-terminal domain-containing protein [Marinovum sp.]|nr:MlrC C-terminal domain-containing protein [Marinovum sp.]